ncbi:MAG: LuxR C-terminal-related transcriptional regulator [Kineosporiaceae bacterium]
MVGADAGTTDVPPRTGPAGPLGPPPVPVQPRLLAAADEVAVALADPGVRLVEVLGPAGAGRSTVLARTVAGLRDRGCTVSLGEAPAAPGPADAAGPVAVVDDAHLADPGLLRRLRHRCATDHRVRVVLSVPAGVAVPEEVDALRAELPSRVVRIAPFDVVDVLLLLGDLLGEPVAGDTAARIQRDTGGRPGLVAQLCRQAVADGSFRRDPAGRLSLAGDLPVPWALTVSGLTSAVPDDVRGVLRLLAVADGPVPVDAVERIAGPGPVERALVTSTVTVEHEGGRDRLVHASPWVGAGIRSALPAGTRRDLLRAVARTTLATVPAATPDGVRALRWLLRAGDRPPPGMLEDAVTAACRHGDARLAEELAGLAGETGISSPRAEEAVRLMRRREGAAPWRQGVQATRQAVQAVVDGALELYLNHGRVDDADRIARAVSASLPASSPVGVTLTALRASILLSTNRVDEALAASAPLPLDRVETLALRLATLVRAGRPVDAVQVARRLTAVDLGSQRYGHFRHTVYSYSAIASAHAGGLHAARRRARRQYELALLDDRPVAAASWALALGIIESLAGCPHATAAVMRDGVALMEEVQCGGGPAAQILGLVVLARAQIDTGDATAARESLARIESIGPLADRLAVVDTVRGLLAGAEGDDAAARALLSRSARASAAAGAHHDSAWACLHLARAGAAREAARQLAATARQLQGPVLLGIFDAVRAIAAGSAEAMDRVEDRLAALGAGGVRAVVLEARARLGPDPDGSAPGASGHGAGDEDLRPEPASPAPEHLATLTGRQRQVVALVARGHSNAEAAEHLGLSRRTVEVHLQLAYDKLGVHDRRALMRIPGLAERLADGRAVTDDPEPAAAGATIGA